MVMALSVHDVTTSNGLSLATFAGREAPGKAFRLYTEDTYHALQSNSKPEILRVNLALTVLQLKAMGVSDVLGFDFLERPPAEGLAAAQALLASLGALDGDANITPLGRLMVCDFPGAPPLPRPHQRPSPPPSI